MFTFNQVSALAPFLGGHVALTAQQNTAIKTEIQTDPTSRNYAGAATNAGKLAILLTPYAVADANTQPRLNRFGVASSADLRDELMATQAVSSANLYLALRRVAATVPAGGATQAEIDLWDSCTMVLEQLNKPNVNFSDPATYAIWDTWAARMAAANLVTSARVNRIVRSRQHPSRLDEILFPGGGFLNNVITLPEFENALL